MSTRERWVVYPLLFLTFGIVMRDKFIGQKHFRAVDVTSPEITADNVTAYREITAHTIRCAQLEAAQVDCRGITVTGTKGAEGLRMGLAPGGGGRLVLFAKNGNPALVAGVDDNGRSGTVETYNRDGVMQVKLFATQAGGAVTTIRRDQKIWLVMGYEGPYYGVFAESPESGRGLPLTLPWRFDIQPGPKPPPSAQRPESADPAPGPPHP